MAFSKTIFVDNQTVIDADTLNAIQDELIRVGGLLGKDIQSAAINDSGHLILTLTDGTTLDAGVAKGAQGEKGATGPAGPQGPAGAPGKDGTAGADGITPHIGDNGNWYLGDEDTGVAAKGVKGDTGPQGPKGGDGAKGDTGPQGPKGDDGAKGDTGPSGADGVTPHIGDNGNWYLGETDTGKPSRGKTGPTGADGKSAYRYAVEGGYTGTKEEFAAKLAQEPLIGTTNDLTPKQVYDAVSAGIPVKVQYTDSTYGLLSFTAFNVAESLSTIVSQTIVYYNGVYILAELFGNKSNGIWGFMTTTLAEKKDIPSKLPNPNALTIKIGSTTVTYDGSTAQTVTIADGSEVSY